MRFMWLGTSCFILEAGGLRILFDPYLESRASFNPPPLKPSEIKDLDLVLVTHGHYDHFVDAPSLLRSTEAKLVASRELCDYAKAKLGVSEARLIPLNQGEVVEVEGVKIEATRGEHMSPLDVIRWFIGDFSYTPSSRDELRRMYAERFPQEVLRFASEVPMGPLQGYLLTGGRGLRAWNPSETVFFEGLEELARRAKPEVLFPCVAGGFERDAVKLVEWSRPKVVVPHSFDKLFERQALLGDVNLFKELVASACPGTEVLIPRPGEWYSL